MQNELFLNLITTIFNYSQPQCNTNVSLYQLNFCTLNQLKNSILFIVEIFIHFATAAIMSNFRGNEQLSVNVILFSPLISTTTLPFCKGFSFLYVVFYTIKTGYENSVGCSVHNIYSYMYYLLNSQLMSFLSLELTEYSFNPNFLFIFSQFSLSLIFYHLVSGISIILPVSFYRVRYFYIISVKIQIYFIYIIYFYSYTKQ